MVSCCRRAAFSSTRSRRPRNQPNNIVIQGLKSARIVPWTRREAPGATGRQERRPRSSGAPFTGGVAGVLLALLAAQPPDNTAGQSGRKSQDQCDDEEPAG